MHFDKNESQTDLSQNLLIQTYRQFLNELKQSNLYNVMELNLKKKTKHLIALRTNNFIQTETEKQVFFNQVLHALQKNLDPKQFQFLTTYLLSQENPNHKRIKNQHKNPTQKRIMTQPDEKPFNLGEIDPNLFQDFETDKKPFSMLKMNKKISINNLKKQNDFRCTSTPKRKIKHIAFENKRILDLDRKLQQKYQKQNSSLIYKPNFLLIEGKQNKNSNNFVFKTTYQNSFIKKNNLKSQMMKRLKTSFASSRDEELLFTRDDLSNDKTSNNLSFRRSQMCHTVQTQRNRNTENSSDSIPKRLMDQVLLSRKYFKQKFTNNDFSDLKMQSKYRDCFS